MKPNASIAVETTAKNPTTLVVTKGGHKEPLKETKTAPKADEKPQVTAPKQEIKREPTLQELKERATILYLLQEKHTKLVVKRASLDRFAIKHEEDNAEITVRDASGEEFNSSSPKTIGKLLEFWKVEFDEAIGEVENKLKEVFAITQ